MCLKYRMLCPEHIGSKTTDLPELVNIRLKPSSVMMSILVVTEAG